MIDEKTAELRSYIEQVEQLVCLLSRRILQFYKKDCISEQSFAKQLFNIHKKVKTFE